MHVMSGRSAFMNPIVEQVSRSQDHMAPKKSYEKPKVLTFGSVAKVTQGTHSVGSDGFLGHTKNKRG